MRVLNYSVFFQSASNPDALAMMWSNSCILLWEDSSALFFSFSDPSLSFSS